MRFKINSVAMLPDSKKCILSMEIDAEIKDIIIGNVDAYSVEYFFDGKNTKVNISALLSKRKLFLKMQVLDCDDSAHTVIVKTQGIVEWLRNRGTIDIKTNESQFSTLLHYRDENVEICIDTVDYFPDYDFERVTGWIARDGQNDICVDGSMQTKKIGCVYLQRKDVEMVYENRTVIGFECLFAKKKNTDFLSFSVRFGDKKYIISVKEHMLSISNHNSEIERLLQNIGGQSLKSEQCVVEPPNNGCTLVLLNRCDDLSHGWNETIESQLPTQWDVIELSGSDGLIDVSQIHNEWICFADTNDTISLEWFFRMINTKTKSKLIFSDYQLDYQDEYVAKVIRTKDGLIDENPECILTACMIRTNELKNCNKLSEVRERVVYAIKFDDYEIVDNLYEFYHRNVVEQKEFDDREVSIKPIAFYLPQFHENEENNEWWGKGFTEWNNVKRAKPMIDGQHQPRIPTDLGYYDLIKDEEIMKKQAGLAKSFGVYGFCFYYYWFSGKRLLRKPVDRFLENKNIEIPFCICWANESWTRRWDGLEKEVLMEQNHNKDTDVQFIYDIIPILKDERYVRINGKLLLIVYRADLFPDPIGTFKAWKDICKKERVGDLYIAEMQSFSNVSPYESGADGAIEFPPHKINMGENIIINRADVQNLGEFKGNVFDYSKVVKNTSLIIRRKFDFYPGCMLEWDNTARRMENSNIFYRFSLNAFKHWCITNFYYSKLYNWKREGYFFINAWNEWAEGSYLEPDEKYGLDKLQVIKDVEMMK